MTYPDNGIISCTGLLGTESHNVWGDSDSTLPPDSDNHLFIRIEKALIAIFCLACILKRQLHTLLCLG